VQGLLNEGDLDQLLTTRTSEASLTALSIYAGALVTVVGLPFIITYHNATNPCVVSIPHLLASRERLTIVIETSQADDHIPYLKITPPFVSPHQIWPVKLSAYYSPSLSGTPPQLVIQEWAHSEAQRMFSFSAGLELRWHNLFA
jgi:hypothetical protein